MLAQSSNFTYRPMRADDIGSFYDVRFSVKENRIHPHQVNLLDRDLVIEKIGQGGGWVCEQDGEVVGVCLPALTEKPFISGLFIRPSCHAHGIGRELLERSVRWLRERGATSVKLVTDPGSRADGFYQHLGWQRHGLDEYGCQIVFTLDLMPT
ncbi:GNAT family N-acetyltransferase [Paraburkholderia phenazinium]|jgi:GNAT superfamily N-acetyltransferase|uniref:Acetyltransferase (GNAT) domain-containing protein n=1 Tax=Paraburkholderia phenazinium TaxID=60549 RepID=A0A1G7WYZ7_9BURK|nr:GNAT family N-acetyltransferase [Paraburkholderia phenazinium]SDG77136.1 Acetyltransferase (GNAT) domain-containing protein [Paraburkholderia phenazinium]